MRNYVAMELKVLVLEDEDVLTASAEFKDASTGDNGVWFPGNDEQQGGYVAMRKQFTLVASLAFVAALSAGFAAANVQADAAASMADFAITATSVRLDDPQKEGVDSGLRFKVDIPQSVEKADVTNAYTKISFTTANAQAYSTNVNATVWRVDESGWNTVLLDIPASDYITEITAQAFVTVNEVEYETAAVTASIAQTSAKAIAMGTATEENVGHYVAGKVESINLDKATASLDQLTGTAQLSATTQPVDFAVVWKSDNEAVATVDKDGKVTAHANGTANITATMGGTESTACVVNANNMAISFSEEAPAAVITNMMNAKKASDTTTYQAQILDFNGGKAIGVAETGTANRTTCFAVSYATVNSFFTAYPSAAAFSFEVYTNCKVNDIRWYYTVANDTTAANNNIFCQPRVINNTGLEIDGATYYKTMVYVNKATFEAHARDTALIFYFNSSYGTTLSSFYLDNFGVISNVKAEYDFEDDMASPIAFIGANVTTSGYGYKSITITGEAATMVVSQEDANQLSSSTAQIPVHRTYLDALFADKNVDFFQFDIIANWPAANVANLQVEDYTYTMKTLATYANAEAVTVDGVEGFYRVTVRLDRATYEEDLAKFAEGNATSNLQGRAPNNCVIFRYKWGGQATKVYIDNLKGGSLA